MLIRQVWPGRPTFNTSTHDHDQVRREMMRALEMVSGTQESPAAAGVFPAINVSQDDNHFYVRAELPGVVANELSISALRNRLSISGKRDIGKEHERASYHRKERPEGTFSRTLTLPTPIDEERIEARYTDGVLTLVLPKTAEAKPRQIVVKT